MCAQVPYIPPPYRTWDCILSLSICFDVRAASDLPSCWGFGVEDVDRNSPTPDLRAMLAVEEKELCVGREVSPGWMFRGCSLQWQIFS